MKRPFHRRRLGAATVLGAVLALASATLVLAGPASATGTGRVLADPCLNLRSGPNGSTSLIGCIPKNTTIAIDCTAQGNSVSGPYGATTLWDHTNWNGRSGFVSDAWVYTGTPNAVAGGCSNGGPAPAPSASRESRALGWLNARAGNRGYDGLCETMVENAYGTRGQYATANANYAAQRNAGRLRTDRNPPAGALVFYRGTTSAGHVEISNGDGRYWTSDGSVHLVNFSWGGTYYGWSYAPAGWPGV